MVLYIFSTSPLFQIVISQFKVTLRASGSQVFKGFLLQARRVGQTAPYGTWVGLPANTRVTTCQVAGDTATHLNTQSKTSLTFTWQAPNTNTGTVEF